MTRAPASQRSGALTLVRLFVRAVRDRLADIAAARHPLSVRTK